MNKSLLLGLLLILCGQAFAQKVEFKGNKEFKPAVWGQSSVLQPLLEKDRNDNIIPGKAVGLSAKPLKASPVAPAMNLNAGKDPEYWPDRLLVKLKNGQQAKLQTYASKNQRPRIATGNKVNLVLQSHQPLSVLELPRSAKTLSNRNTYEVKLEKPAEMQQLIQELQASPEVAYVERVPYYVTFGEPNDPDYVSNKQYALLKTKAAEAFAIHTGSARTLLAVVDDAVLVSHPDLADNINTAKSYDVADNDADPRPPSSGTNKASPTQFSHGTHCAGIAGAVTSNSVGIAAISNNKVSIIGVKCTRDAAPSSRAIEYATEGILYAINQGARVISMSFGGTGYSQTMQNIINEATANGVVFVAAAGNDNTETKMYPAAYDNVIAVASTDANDLKSTFSNYGTWVDIAAPGTDILSTVTANDGFSGAYTQYSGTSMACPMVASLAAYMLSENPRLTPQAVNQLLRSTADSLENVPNQSPALAGKLGSGRINAYRAIEALKNLTHTQAPEAITDLRIAQAEQTTLQLAWTAPDAGGTAAATYDIRYATFPIDASNFETATKTKQSVFPAEPGTSQQLLIKDLAPGTNYYFAMVAHSFYGEPSPLSNVAQASTKPSPVIQVSPASFNLSLNRNLATSASGNFSLSNAGTVALHYQASVIPVSGSNILAYDKQQAGADNAVGLGGGSFHTAARFVAGSRGFRLSHVQNFLGNSASTGPVSIGLRILKGGTNPANATLLSSETFSRAIAAGGSLHTFPLQTAHQFAPGEVFWIVFVLPEGLDYPQGFDNVGANAGTFFLSTNNGSTYSDAQTLASFLANAAFKIRPAYADWLVLEPAAGEVSGGQASALQLTCNTGQLADGEYQAQVLFQSNDAVTPQLSRPVTFTISGGQPEFVLAPQSIDFGTLFVGTSRTVTGLVSNTGTATLSVKPEAFAVAPFAPGDFSINTTSTISLEPGKQQQVQVTFTPSRQGKLNGMLTLSTNDPKALMVNVPLQASVVAPPVALAGPDSLNFELDYPGQTTAAQEINLANKGEADLEYTLQTSVDPQASISYGPDRPADNYLGYGARYPYIHTALKFDVSTAAFTLTHVQNYFRSETTAGKTVTLKVYRGGSAPTAGTLLLEQSFETPAAAANGILYTLALQQPQQFKQGEVFWVVFSYINIPRPQGYHTNTPNPGRNFYSSNGSKWSSLESVGGALATSTYVIKALEMPQWLSVPTQPDTLAAGKHAQPAVQVNTAGLAKGRYKGLVQVLTNDPNKPVTTIQVNLNLEESPVAGFTARLQTVIPGEAVSFVNTSQYADAYEWQFEGADSTSSRLAAPVVSYSTPGKYKVSLLAKNTRNNRTSAPLVKEGYIQVQHTVCAELNSPFADTTLLAADQQGYKTGNNQAGDLAKANYFDYRRPEAYLTGIKVKFGAAQAASAQATLQVGAWQANADGTPGALLAVKEVRLSEVAADVAGGRLTEVLFDAPVRLAGSFFAGVILNNTPGNIAAIAHNAQGGTSPGLAWTQDSGKNWKPMGAIWPELTDISLYIQPAITQTRNPLLGDFSMNAVAACVGQQVTLDAALVTGAGRYEWVLEGASVTGSTEARLQVSYATPGTYRVMLKAYGTCSGMLVLSKTITINALPEATITASGPTSLCEGGKVSLSAPAGENYTYRWSTGATTRSIETGESGNYTVTITNASGCSITSAATRVQVHALPQAEITASGPTTFCEGQSVTLTASEASSYLWSNGATTRQIVVKESGSFSVQVSNAAGCQLTSATVTIVVKPVPVASITASGPTTFCAGGKVSLSAPAGENYTYRWSTGATTRSIEVRESGNYTVTITNASGCSITSAATRVQVTALPQATITMERVAGRQALTAAAGSTNTLCQGDMVALSAPEGEGYSYRWNNGATSRTILVGESGNYQVQISNAAGCTVTSGTVVVKINPLPVATITPSGPTTLCQGEKVTLTAASGEGYTYRWNTGATTRSIETGQAGDYFVTITNASGCSETSALTQVQVQAPPQAKITASGPTTFCQGGSVTLTASEGSSYLWSNGATSRSITVFQEGTYSVRITQRPGCTATSPGVKVSLHPKPAKPVITRQDMLLTSSAVTGNQWFRNKVAIPGATGRTYEVTEPGVYQVQVSNAAGCTFSLSDETEVKTAELIVDLKVYPNPGNGLFNLAFSGLKPDKVKVRILNGLGHAIYEEEKTMQDSREFQVNLTTAPSGVYILQVQHNGHKYSRRVVVVH